MTKIKNPFEIKTPELNTADEIVKLFVDVFTDFYQVPETGHTFINGPRGSGKSMMFRYILPDCQKIVTGKDYNELDYFSIYIPIKLTSINLADFKRLESHANTILNEHIFVTYVLSKAFLSLLQTFNEDYINKYTQEIKHFYNVHFTWFIKSSGFSKDISISEELSGVNYFERICTIIDEMHMECMTYCKQLALNQEVAQYNGSMADFMWFMYPLLCHLKKLPVFPAEKPFYLLIDDAGYLNLEQTKVLNTWVSYRTTKELCIKISTQLDYKTFLTTNGKRIDAPHDYSEVNIATIYTSGTRDYSKKIQKIVEKRLSVYLNKQITSEEFFPENSTQETRIDQIYTRIKQANNDVDKGYAGSDAGRRYCRSEFIKELRTRRATNKYSYAGFNQLVAISSGVIRHFLAPAQEMFSVTLSRNEGKEFDFIAPNIQDEIITKYSKKFLHDEFDKIFKDDNLDNNVLRKADKLYNLIDSLGQIFHLILLSDRAERTVFSVALNDRPDAELKEILDLGVQHGYFHVSSKRNKESTGQVLLYVLSRVLAPVYILNPLSFAGYQSMSSAELKVALTHPVQFVKNFKQKLAVADQNHPTLFD